MFKILLCLLVVSISVQSVSTHNHDSHNHKHQHHEHNSHHRIVNNRHNDRYSNYKNNRNDHKNNHVNDHKKNQYSDYCKLKCPLFDPVSTTVHLPGPSKKQFYKCRYGVGILFMCPPGTNFNPREQVCDWPWRAHAVVCRGSPNHENEGSGEGEEGSGDGGDIRIY